MEEEQLKENEKFFINILSILNEDGRFAYPAINEIFKKKDDVFYGTENGINEIKKIVSEDFFNKHFKVEIVILN